MVSDQRTGINNVNATYFLEKQASKATLVGKNKIFVGKDGFTYAPAGISFIAPQLPYKYLDPILAYEFFREDYIDFSSPSVYQPGEGLVTNTVGNKLNSGFNSTIPNQVFTQEQINSYVPTSKENTLKPSFTTIIAPTGSVAIPGSLSYIDGRIEKRVSLGDPGIRGNLTSYVVGKLPSGSSGVQTEASIRANSGYDKALDKITSFPLYQTTGLPPKETNDLVKFRIGVLDNTDPTKKTYVHFRALIDSFSDQYTSDWNSQKYMGRGENFYKYNGFDRQISLSWTVAAQSKQELIPMYQKLNYLSYLVMFLLEAVIWSSVPLEVLLQVIVFCTYTLSIKIQMGIDFVNPHLYCSIGIGELSVNRIKESSVLLRILSNVSNVCLYLSSMLMTPNFGCIHDVTKNIFFIFVLLPHNNILAMCFEPVFRVVA